MKNPKKVISCFLVSITSILLSFLLLMLVYRGSIVKWHALKDMLVSALYVVPFTALQCLLEEGVFRYSILYVFKKVSVGLKEQSQVILKWALIVLSSLLFALMHFWSDVGAVFILWQLFLFYFAFGMYFSILAFRFSSITLPYFLHFFNNLFTFLIVSTGESLAMFKPLFLLTVDVSDPAFLLLNFGSIVLFTEIGLILLKFFATDKK